jgi:hypothetical protein
MSDIIQRKKAVPVEAHRVEPVPEVINIPGTGPVPVPPQTPGVTQTIIYVNVPQGQAASPQAATPPPSEPREVHHHTTNIYQSPKRRRLGRGTSFLGTLGLVLGGVAAGAAYVPPVAWLAKPIAVAGFGCAGFGFIGALLFNRVGRFMPMLGMIGCAVGYCLWMKNTGQPIELPKLDLNLNPTPAAPAVNTPTAPAAKPARQQDHSIFGDGDGGWTKPTDVAPSTPLTTPSIAVPQLDVVTATSNLEKARDAAAARMNIDYAGAKSAAVTAAANYQQAKINNSPDSPELIVASKAHMEADSQLNEIEGKLRSDPAVSAAEVALKSVKASAR